MRYLRPRKQKGFVSLITVFSFLGVMLGVATLIIVMAVMNGFHNQLSERIIGVNGHVNLLPIRGMSLKDPNFLLQALRDNSKLRNKILGSEPVVEGQALATANGRTTGVIVRGVLPSAISNSPHLASALKNVSGFTGDTVLVGQRFAARYGLRIGDTVRLISPSSASTAFGSIPTARVVKIIGLFDVGMYEYDTGYLFIPLETAQRLYRKRGQVDYIDIRLEDPKAASKIAESLSRDFKSNGVWARSWQERNQAFFSALQTERNVMFLILTLIILVADFNIISSMIMMVKDKGREIAILRALGVTRWGIIRIFTCAGTLIGAMGSLFGFGLGLAFSKNVETLRTFINETFDVSLFPAEVYYLTNLPADLEWSETIAVVAMALILSFLATIWPAWKAGLLDPVEGLRYE